MWESVETLNLISPTQNARRVKGVKRPSSRFAAFGRLALVPQRRTPSVRRASGNSRSRRASIQTCGRASIQKTPKFGRKARFPAACCRKVTKSGAASAPSSRADAARPPCFHIAISIMIGAPTGRRFKKRRRDSLGGRLGAGPGEGARAAQSALARRGGRPDSARGKISSFRRSRGALTNS